MVRVWFKLGHFNYCDLIFEKFKANLEKKVIEGVKEAGLEEFIGDPFQELPFKIIILYHYYKGRFHLYNNEFG